MDKTDLPDAVRAANARCARGEHPQRPADPRVVAFYDALTSDYPDRGPRAGAPGSPPLDTMTVPDARPAATATSGKKEVQL